ncbi:MAG TPA: hypothetical protein VN723_01120 [Rhizomicrobium sp.]|nr:hypothetical protein [Rhizomicrobium sp.]
MPHEIDRLADNFIGEHGCEAISLAFHLAAKCLQNQDSEGYERYFQIYVRLVQRSGRAGALSAWHEQVSRQEFDNNRPSPSGNVERH